MPVVTRLVANNVRVDSDTGVTLMVAILQNLTYLCLLTELVVMVDVARPASRELSG